MGSKDNIFHFDMKGLSEYSILNKILKKLNVIKCSPQLIFDDN